MVQLHKATGKAPRRKVSNEVVGVLSNGVVRMYALDKPTLEKLKLPTGAFYTIVATEPAAAKALEKTGMVRNAGSYRMVTKPQPLPEPAIDMAAFEPDARSRALLRGRDIARTDLKAAGGAFDLAQVRELLHGVARQRIDARVKEGSLLAVPGPSNRRRFPTVQFTRDGEVVAGLKDVQMALPTRNPWAVLNFFVQPDDRLNGRKPIDVLKAGDIDAVVSAARSMGHAGG